MGYFAGLDLSLEETAICIEGRQAKAAMSAMPSETDRNDARGIVQIMRTGPRPSADKRAFGQ